MAVCGLGQFIDSDLMEKYDAKSIEYETSNRTYCAKSSCSEFIDSETIVENRAVCTSCDTVTCARCKEVQHEGRKCQGPTTNQALRQIAKKEGWVTCPRCRRIIELAHGCDHMTYVSHHLLSARILTVHRCPCKTEFCYECGMKWKGCDCPVYAMNMHTARFE